MPPRRKTGAGLEPTLETKKIQEELTEVILEFSCSTFAKSARYRATDNMLRMAQGDNNIEWRQWTYE
jgi:hypothetical protein